MCRRARGAFLALCAAAVLAVPTPRAVRPLATPLGRFARTRRLRTLREELSDAVRSQNFALAARLKAERDELRADDPVRELRARLSRAIACEDFAAASELRDELRSAQRRTGPFDSVLFLSPDGLRLWVRGGHLLLDELPEDGLDEAVVLQPDDLAPGSYRLQQPTWSPSGTRVAATLLLPSASSGELVIFDALRGGELARVALPAPPFYYMWSADERYITCLSASAGRLVLLAVELRTGEVLTLARGAPLFYAMARGRADRRLVAHNGGANAVQLLADYGPVAQPVAPAASGPWRTICTPAGGFQSPCWCRWREPSGALGEAIVFAERGRVVAVQPEVRVSAATRRRVLYTGTDEAAASDGSGARVDPPLLLFVVSRCAQAVALLSAAAPSDLLLLSPSTRADRPCLLDVSSNVAPHADHVDLNGALPRGERVSEVSAFWFSPGGRWLLALARTAASAAAASSAGTGAGARGQEARGAPAASGWRWVIFDCEAKAPLGATPRCELTPSLLQQYVPFFTQYAQSVSPFAPDGGAFCFVTDEGGFVATLHPEMSEIAARITITPLPNKPARPEVMWWSGPVTDALDDVDMDLDDRRW